MTKVSPDNVYPFPFSGSPSCTAFAKARYTLPNLMYIDLFFALQAKGVPLVFEFSQLTDEVVIMANATREGVIKRFASGSALYCATLTPELDIPFLDYSVSPDFKTLRVVDSLIMRPGYEDRISYVGAQGLLRNLLKRYNVKPVLNTQGKVDDPQMRLYNITEANLYPFMQAYFKLIADFHATELTNKRGPAFLG